MDPGSTTPIKASTIPQRARAGESDDVALVRMPVTRWRRSSQERNTHLGPIFNAVLPLLAALAALAVGAVLLLLLDADPLQAYAAMVEGAFGNPNAFAETLVKATPLLLVGVGICIAFRGGVINIGGEGQYIAGALLATVFALHAPAWPSWLLITVSVLLAFLGGAIWGGVAGALKAYLKVNEILSTIMLNQIAVQGMNFLLRGPLIDPLQAAADSQIPQTARFAVLFDLPRLVPTRLHLGALIAVLVAVLGFVLLWRTSLGYRIRAVGINPHASRYAGIRVERYVVLALLLSGAFAGMAGGIQVLGVSHRMLTDGSGTGFTGSVGFNGIVAALFGGLHPLGTIPASVLFGGLLVGANHLQRALQVPTSLVPTLNGLVVVFVVSSEIWKRRRARVQSIPMNETDRAAPEDGPAKAALQAYETDSPDRRPMEAEDAL